MPDVTPIIKTVFLSVEGKIFLILLIVLFSFSVMIERVPEWLSPHIAKCGLEFRKEPQNGS